ncbi:MAG: hypothetical protein ACRD2L_19820, partial [Terriglobia bacterium]
LWGDFYVNLIDDLKSRGPWFSSAALAVSWFRKRRSAVFDTVGWESGALRAKVSVDIGENLPGLRLRIHKAREPCQLKAMDAQASEGYVDLGFNDSIDTCIPIAGPEAVHTVHNASNEFN